MEELLSFSKHQDRFRDAGLIAISLVILQVWISSGVHDIPSSISLIAFAVSIPMLTFDLLFAKTDLLLTKIDMLATELSSSDDDSLFSHFKSTTMIFFFNMNRIIGTIGSVIGIVAAIWHVLWIAGLLFLVIGIISFSLHVAITPDDEDLLERAYKLGIKESKDLHKKAEEEFLKDFYHYD
jgi:hypothetical protein